MAWRLIPAASLVASPWRNGHGVSREIAGAVPGGVLGWQVSIADLVADAPFSHYPGAERIFTPIAGDPAPELAFDGGPFEPCPLLQPRVFPGDRAVLSRIPAPGRAFNVIVDQREWRAEVRVLRLDAGALVAVPDAAYVVLHCLGGTIVAGAARLGLGDSVLGAGVGLDPPVVVDPGPAILVVLLPATARPADGSG